MEIEIENCPRCGSWMDGFTPICNDCYDKMVADKEPQEDQNKDQQLS